MTCPVDPETCHPHHIPHCAHLNSTFGSNTHSFPHYRSLPIFRPTVLSQILPVSQIFPSRSHKKGPLLLPQNPSHLFPIKRVPSPSHKIRPSHLFPKTPKARLSLIRPPTPCTTSSLALFFPFQHHTSPPTFNSTPPICQHIELEQYKLTSDSVRYKQQLRRSLSHSPTSKFVASLPPTSAADWRCIFLYPKLTAGSSDNIPARQGGQGDIHDV